MIKYRLVDDPKKPGKKVAELIHSDLLDIDDIVAELPGGFAMKDKYKKIIYDFFNTAFEQARKEGKTVNTPLLLIKPTGKIDENGEFEIEVTPGEALQEAIKKVKLVEVEGEPEPDPVKISFVHDLLSDSTNKYITPGGIIEISGKFLKIRPFQGNGEQESLSFCMEKTGESFKIENILTNSVHKIVAELPEDLPEGAGYLTITTGMFDNPKKMRPSGKSKLLIVKPIGRRK